MTESPFPFGAVEEAPALEESESGSRRNLLALGGLAALLVAGGAAFFLLSGGEETSEDIAFVPPARTTVTTPAVAVPKAVTLPVATNVPLGRNPFKALYVQPAAAPADAAPTGPATAPALAGGPAIVLVTPTAPTGGTSPGSAPFPGPTDGGAAPAPGTPPVAVQHEHELVLRQVSGKGDALSAAFTIDGKPTSAKVGETFGPTSEIKLLSLQEGPKPGRWTAVLQVGDAAPFDVVIGESVRVR